ncbi:MAG TPA: hypothetical protein VMD78_04590 [Candidatus Baltobacteraceae bacterium]|nr:hypothetical protein [Candidatus Baltobacteraceae bacterium]
MTIRVGLIVLVAALAAAVQAWAYDDPLTSDSIREAYFLGTGPQGKQGSFFDSYAYSFHMPNTDLPGSLVTIETPFLQVVERASRAPNYDAQAAVKEFLGKPAVFRVYADVYYRPQGADASSDEAKVTLTVVQNGKAIAPDSIDQWPLDAFHDAGTGAVRVGEHVQLEFNARKIDASTLTIEVSDPQGESKEADFDLSTIR